MKHLLIFLFSFFYSNFIFAQLDTTFWFVAPEVAQNHGDRPIVFRFATLANPATIIVYQPANPSFPAQILNLGANSAQTLDLSPWIDITENKPANTVLNFGFKITATSQITAYYEVVTSCNCNPDIFSLKGKNSLGTSFLTPFQNYLSNASYARSGFNIVATENNTTVTIVPSQNIVGHLAGIPFSVTLNKGQTYSAEGLSTSASQHLSGSSVVSNKKVAITIHDDSALGTPYGGCADLQGDQLIPISVIGTEYIALKGYLNGPDKVYILATSNGTSLSIDGVNVGTINASQTYVHTLSNPTAYIVSSDSVYVLHQSGFGCEVGEAILPPVVCTGSNVVPFTRSTNEFFAVNILVSTGGESSFTYNGAGGIINPSNFNFVPGTNNNWMYAQINMSGTVPVQQGSRIANQTTKFHMGIIHGGSSSGCRFGYFSDFASLRYEVQSANNTYCKGETVNLTSNMLPGATYTWTGPNNFQQTGASISINNIQLANSGVYIISGQLPGMCVLIADTIIISLNPEPLVSNQVLTVCSDVACGLTLANDINGPTASTYNITTINSNGLSSSAGTPLAANGVLNSNLLDDAWTNTTNAAIDVIYTIVPVSAVGCEGTPFTVTLTINPEPIVSNQVLTVCSDVAFGLTLANDIDGPTASTYNITAINSNGLSSSVGAPLFANGVLNSNLMDDAWTNTTNAPVDVIYTIVPVSAAGCEGTPFTVTLTINPEPVVSNQATTLCSDVACSLTIANDIDGPTVSTYNITTINSNGLISSAGTPLDANGVLNSNLLDDAWTNTTNAPVDVVYTIVPISAAGCVGSPFTLTLTINPEPLVSNQVLTL
jgi:hypothetical protein